MATKTLGTNATTSLTALSFLHGLGSLPYADVASINNAIKNDNAGQMIVGGFSNSDALLMIPRRGVLKVLAGDYVAVDATTGWPILVSAYAIANGPWTHS